MNKVRVLAVCFKKGHVNDREAFPILVIRTDQFDRFINMTGCQLGKHDIVLNYHKVLEVLADTHPEAVAIAAEYDVGNESFLRILVTTAQVYDPHKRK